MPGVEVEKITMADSTKMAKKKSKKDKGEKKAKKEEETEAEAVEVEDDVDTSGDGEKKKKKKKKKSKGGEAAEGAEGEGGGDGDSGEGKKKKKKEKKKRAEASDDEAGGDDEAPKKKKKKKEKSGGQVLMEMSRDIANVGSAEVAKAGGKFNKVFYKPESATMTEGEVMAFRESKGMTVEGEPSKGFFKPITKFTELGVAPNLLHSTRTFTQPSPIQSQCWPIVMSGRDAVAIASTGSGKTLGFGLPALAHILDQEPVGKAPGNQGPVCLILSPTRELAVQIHEVLEDAGAKCGVKSVCVYGGVPKYAQKDAIRAGVGFVVATPGRLQDLMEEGSIKLNRVTYFVLDEADRMLDLGFEPNIRAIANNIRNDRQTLMFSATWPPAISKLASEFLANPIKVTIGSHELSASHSVKQIVEVMEPNERDARLHNLLGDYHKSRKNRVLVFALYKKEASRLEEFLNRKGWKCSAIHGDKSQDMRQKAVNEFKSGAMPLMIATDVAARGLDIPDVEYVINYTFPLTTEDYVHRIGRTGRAGKTGTAHTLFTSLDKARAGELINVLREAGQKVPDSLFKFGTTVKKKESKLYGAHFKDVDMTAKATKTTFASDSEEESDEE